MRILITGTNRGLGLEFVRQYLARGEQVIATCRNLKSAHDLQRLQEQYGQSISIHQLEVTDAAGRAALAETVQQKFGGIEMLINNAAIRSGNGKNSFKFGEMHGEDISKVFDINTIAPLLMVEEFLTLLEKGTDAKVVNISSLLGSISSRTSLYMYSYSASKSALNMFTKLLAIQLRKKSITVLALHPGHAQTDLGGYSAPLTPEESIRGMIEVIDGLTIEDSGRFLDWQGRELPW